MRSTPNPPLTVDVTGFQWQWTFDYKDQGLSFTGQGKDGPEMVLPVGEDVHFRLHSNDVIHSFYVPGFFFKRDVVPGRTNEFDLTLDQTGTYTGQCAEFCGLGHADMRFTVQAVSPADFDGLGGQGAGGRQGHAVAAAQRRAEPHPERLQHDRLRPVHADGARPASPSPSSSPTSRPPAARRITSPSRTRPAARPARSPASRWPRRARRSPTACPPWPPGTYTFICIVHPNMTGTLTVK